MAQSDPAPTAYLLAEKQAFSQSVLWDLQARYFAEKGVDAWRQGEVPHYVSSNPTLANSYAEIVLAVWRDHQRHTAPDQPGQPKDEPLYVCELGAGSGRFAFHFLKRLTRLCEQAGVDPHTFCYVLTDVAEANLEFWRHHPRLQAYFADGRLDLARFDVTQSKQLRLQHSRRTIRAGSLVRPLVVIANYVFDSIPQDLFYIDQQRCSKGLVSLWTEADPTTLSPEQMLEQVHCTFEFEELSEAPYAEPYLQACLADYQHSLSDTHLLFPAAGLRYLQRLRALSKPGLCVLSADKGLHRLSAIQGQAPPHLISHGSFSLSVNYHAFKTFCEYTGGLALLPRQHHHHLIVSSLLLLQESRREDDVSAGVPVGFGFTDRKED